MLNFLTNLSVTDWLAIACGAGLVLTNFGGQILAWIKAQFPSGGGVVPPPDTAAGTAADLTKKFNLWLQLRSLPDLSPEAIKDLELLKNELLKWE